MSDHDSGQVEANAAVVYDEFFVPALFGRFAEQVADAAEIGAGDAVIDVACGTGALTRAVRRRTSGEVTGVDISSDMLAVARRHGGDVNYRVADAQQLPFEAAEFDLAVSQFGVMFLPDPAAGVAEMARVARRGLVAVWDGIGRSDGYTAMQELFRDELGDDAAASLDAPFSMGEDGVLDGIIAAAGVADAAFASVSGTGRFASVAEWVRTEVRGWTLGESVSDQRLAALVAVAERRLDRFQTPSGCEFGMGVRVARWG